jgi:DNA mismatch repair protein MSH5
MQANIRTEVVSRVCGFSQVLHRASALAAEVDCLVSLALAAREYNYVRPVLTTDNILHIRRGVYWLLSSIRVDEGSFEDRGGGGGKKN